MPIAKRGTIYNTERWRRLTAAVKRRDRYRCRTCGAPGRRIGGDATLTVQHVKPARDFPALALDPENLKTLCDVCHGREDGPRGAFKYGQ